MTYVIREWGPFWIVSANGAEVMRYRKDAVAWSGHTDIAELKREVRGALRLARGDSIMVVP